jgi:hypothetical protein
MDKLLLNWGQFDTYTACIIFFTYMLIDAMYAYYTIEVTKKKPFNAASVGAIMHFMIAFGVLSYVENYLYVFPLALGSFVGTYITIKYGNL